jgi:hypothetical protein
LNARTSGRLDAATLLRPAQAQRTGVIRHTHQAFQQVRHIFVAQLEVAVPALRLHGDQARVEQLGKMRTGRLFGDVRPRGQLGRGQRLTAHQGGEDVGAGGIADQAGDMSDAGTEIHGSIIAEPSPPTRA